MSYDEDESFYQIDAAMADFAEDVLQNTSKENIRAFLGSNGDAIAQRVDRLRDAAAFLLMQGYFSEAIVSSVTAVELIIRYLLVLPLVQGAFLPNEIAAILTSRIGTGRSADDRSLLPALLRVYGIDLSSFTLSSGDPLWQTFQRQIIEWRNFAVHQGDPCTAEEATISLECLEIFRTNIVSGISHKLGFSIERTGHWSHIEIGDPNDLGKTSGSTIYTVRSPFSRPGGVPTK